LIKSIKKIKTIQLKNVGHKWGEVLAFEEQLIYIKFRWWYFYF